MLREDKLSFKKNGPFSGDVCRFHPFPHFGMSPDPRQDPKTVELVEIFMEDSGRWNQSKVVPWKGSFV